MISDEERKKAVKFLRERECVKLDCHECYQMSEMLLGRQNALCAIDEQWGALADLIEPERETTEDVSDDYGKFECGKCGCRIDDVTAVDNGGINFCPDCGREIGE